MIATKCGEEGRRSSPAPCIAAAIRTICVITQVWALVFAVLVTPERMLIYWPEVRGWMAVIATALALLGAVKFTGWHSHHAQNVPDAGFAPTRTS
jgi:hypothetical protein